MLENLGVRKRPTVRKTYLFYIGTGKNTTYVGQTSARNIADAASRMRKRDIRWTSWAVIHSN